MQKKPCRKMILKHWREYTMEVHEELRNRKQPVIGKRYSATYDFVYHQISTKKFV